jgi:hypothetical protein
MKSQSKFEKLIHWIRSQITLRRAWYSYTICLILFVILSIIYPDTFRLSLGISVLTIVMMYLIMVESSIELQRATQTQVKAFVEQLQTLRNELKSVSRGIRILTDVMEEVRQTILESTLVRKRAIAKAEEEKRRRKESIKPQLLIKIEAGGFHWWVIDFRHYHIGLWNCGSDALRTMLTIGNLWYGPHDIKINTQIDIDIGHIDSFRGRSTLRVLIEVRDVDRNPYKADIEVQLPQPRWSAIIPLIET